MAIYDKQLGDFVKQFGEEAVVSAFNLYVSQRERSKAYGEKRKAEGAKVKAILSAAANPDIAAKLKQLGINI